MPTLKPISDLHNYDEVLRHVAHGSPVFLTNDGHSRYALVDFDEYSEYQRKWAADKLMTELAKGRRSIEEGRSHTAEDVRAYFEERYSV